MATGIGALGLDVKALIFQIINFGILLVVLRLVAYKPILAVLDSRRRKIEESIRTADELERAKAALATEREAIIRVAHEHAQQILQRTEQQTRELVAAAETEAARRAQQIRTQAQAAIQAEIETARTQLKRETASLVVAASEKILRHKLDAKADAALIHEAVHEL